MIKTVKLQENGYLLNGNMHVPKAEGNRHYDMIVKYIAEGGKVLPEFTAKEKAEKKKAEKLVKEEEEFQAFKDLKLREEFAKHKKEKK